MKRVRLFQLAVLLAGTAVISLLAWVVRMGAGDTARLVAVAAGGALATGAVGVGALWLLRRARLATQISVVALTSLAAAAVGSFAAARAMFISRHDLAALAVVLLGAVTVAVLVALPLAARFSLESQALASIARQIGQEPGAVEARGPESRELRRVADELIRVSAELAEARRRERAMDASRRELIASVSHDLRTPLSAIRAVAQALEDGVVTDPETVVRYHRALLAETDRLSRLVDDLFALSRAQAGVLPHPLELVPLEDLVSDALAVAAPIAEAKGLRLSGRLFGSTPNVEVSTPDIARALGNVLDNALRHTPIGGSVDVTAGSDREGAYVAVTDSCGGIPDDHLERVFDVAFRGDAERRSDGGGGLGLAIARGILEAHTGSISVSNEDGGCRFVLRLPDKRPSPQRRSPPLRPPAEAAGRAVPIHDNG